jgi:hypothetical protein
MIGAHDAGIDSLLITKFGVHSKCLHNCNDDHRLESLSFYLLSNAVLDFLIRWLSYVTKKIFFTLLTFLILFSIDLYLFVCFLCVFFLIQNSELCNSLNKSTKNRNSKKQSDHHKIACVLSKKLEVKRS